MDLAFELLAERHALQATVERYCYGGPRHTTGLERHVLDYASLEDSFDAVLDSDVILYWGDFLHAYSYWRHALQAETARAARHLLLAGQSREVLHKTLSFGTTLIGDDLRSRTTIDSEYRSALPAFLEQARRVWFRDPISAAQASMLRPRRGEPCLGVDCAQLLTAEDYRSIAGVPTARRDYAGIFFGRVGEPMDSAASLAGSLAEGAGLGTVWIPWFGPGTGAFDTTRRAIPTIDIDASATYEQLIAQVAGARLVISDAYHLCLIAWQLGVPAVCIGLGAQRPSRPISDKKKEIFYLTHGLSPLYLFHEVLSDRANHRAIVTRVLEIVLDPTYVDGVVASLARQAATAEADLWSEIEACLP